MNRFLPLIALGLVACGSTPPRSSVSSSGMGIVPVGEASVLAFSAVGVERIDGAHRAPFATEAPLSSPLAVANDPTSGWSALTYRDSIVVVNTSESRVKRVDGVKWSAPPKSLGIGGTTVGTIEDDTIALYDALEGKHLWKADGRDLLERLGLEDLEYVMPVSPTRMLVVAFKKMSAFSNPQAMVVDLDRSSGLVTSQERPFGSELHWLEACAGDGESLYVAGTQQVTENTGPRQQRQYKHVVVIRHDPKRGRNTTIVNLPQPQSPDLHVTHLAAGHGLVAYALDDGRVCVYDAQGDGKASFRWGEPRPGLSALVCVDPSHVAFVIGSDVQIQRLP